MKEKLQEIIHLLGELNNNIGDARGRDGEYLSDQVTNITELAEAAQDSIE